MSPHLLGLKLRPFFVIVHDAKLTEDLLHEVVKPEITIRNTLEGNVGLSGPDAFDGSDLFEQIRWVARRQEGGLPLVPHLIIEDQKYKRPFSMGLNIRPPPESYDPLRGASLVYPTIPAFSSKHLRFAFITLSEACSVRDPTISRLFLEECQRVSKLLGAFFACGDDFEPYKDPSLRDPRSRAWGVTYYGPKLVSEIGLERLRTAPAHKIEEKDGGVWLYLEELPFVPSPQMEARRDALEHHLGLRERFPPA